MESKQFAQRSTPGRRPVLANRVAVGCVAGVGAALMFAAPVSASPLVHAGPVAVHTQSPAADAIDKKYADFGGASTPLGEPAGDVYAAGNGSGKDYTGGAIYYSEPTGAHVMYGIILDKYKELGGPAGDWGFPTNDEADLPNGAGKVSEFSAPEGASIYWTPAGGAVPVRGAILAAYKELGGPASELGVPTAAQTDANGVVTQTFSGADGTAQLSWSQADGFKAVPPELEPKLANVTVPGAGAAAAPTGQASAPTTEAAAPTNVTDEDKDDDGGFPWWGWLLIALGILALLGGLLLSLLRKRKGDAVGRVQSGRVNTPNVKTPNVNRPNVGGNTPNVGGNVGGLADKAKGAVGGAAAGGVAGASGLGDKVKGGFDDIKGKVGDRVDDVRGKHEGGEGGGGLKGAAGGIIGGGAAGGLVDKAKDALNRDDDKK